MNIITSHEAFVGIIIAIPSFILGYLGYRASQKRDAVAQQSGIASNQIGAVGQVIDGLNNLVASLQEDNRYLRQDVESLRLKTKELSDTCDRLKRELNDLNRKIRSQGSGQS